MQKPGVDLTSGISGIRHVAGAKLNQDFVWNDLCSVTPTA
jgi:hypothetical protein